MLVLRGVNALRNAAKRLAAGSLHTRVQVPDKAGEIAELATAFNDMATALDRHVARISRLNRIHSVLSSIDSALLRIRDKSELLNEACRIAMGHGRFGLVWICVMDPETQMVRPVAWAGTGSEQVSSTEFNLREAVHGAPSIAATAIREDRYIISNDTGNDPGLPPPQACTHYLGYRSCASFPLRIEGRVRGALTLCTEEPGYFDEEEVRLLCELASDTSLGMAYLDTERQLQYLSYFDVLTGLPNLQVFQDRISQAIARAKFRKRFAAVLVVDIDRFRQIVDSAGYPAGDRVLQTVGKYLADSVREGDTVSRIANDIFGILLVDMAGPGDVAVVIDKILENFPQAITVQDEEIFMTVSMGIALWPQDGNHAEELIRNAELVLQAPKLPAGNTYTFHSAEAHTKARERQKIERELRFALERRELALHYQPIVDTNERIVVGAEALLRWTNQQLGTVPPDRFIYIAEETGLIFPIGEWVFENAGRQSLEWHRRGFASPRVAVNVSVKQFRDPDYVERISQILVATDFDPAGLPLSIEITESRLMENMDQVINTLAKFKRMRIHVAIDDFGTGYSSLSYLRRLPIDAIKIDRSFINDIATNADALAVVKGIIALAHSLDLHVIAEGVETQEQLSLLHLLKCNMVQGYLFSRPGPPGEIERLLGRSF